MPVANKTVENNFLAGGGYTIYGGTSPGNPTSHIVIEGNRFGQQYYPLSGQYGPVAYFDPTGAGNIWSGNFWDTTGQGHPLPVTVAPRQCSTPASPARKQRAGDAGGVAGRGDGRSPAHATSSAPVGGPIRARRTAGLLNRPDLVSPIPPNLTNTLGNFFMTECSRRFGAPLLLVGGPEAPPGGRDLPSAETRSR